MAMKYKQKIMDTLDRAELSFRKINSRLNYYENNPNQLRADLKELANVLKTTQDYIKLED